MADGGRAVWAGRARSALRGVRARLGAGGGAPVEETTADVATERAARYGKQLVGHLGRKTQATWDDAAGRGRVEFGGAAAADLVASASGLHLTLRAPADRVVELEGVVGAHLARFGARDGLVVAWTRADGTPGSRHVADADADA